ncbi:hypothetical protein KDK95_28495 [Actinospica sp. MGRD01-02]|uniref:Uncharacterized protein n=1 Tax=Actinospica acidithermotolerans TaxID=2828514 RepID=A0A941IPB9_9ACTN|nr:hypothetical protein [Actinospica acidithermotolerans]MBR7830276.1 hypothetical protein [Actinospica acidithermotolerans]
MEPETGAAVPPEQELTEALLSLSWPLPRTVEDADAALTRLEEVKAVLTRLEQQSVGTDVWWAGQVDGLATQSGFVLEWWRPVLRDPDLDWTLNHQAHLTADLATLASAGARLLDQIEPRAAEEAAAAAHARRVEQEKRWGPTAVPPFPAAGPKPKPPAQVFGDAAELPPPPAPSGAPSLLPVQPTAPGEPVPAASAPPPPAPSGAPSLLPVQPTAPGEPVPAASAPPPPASPAAPPFLPVQPTAPGEPVPAASAPPQPVEPAYDAPPVAAPPSIPVQGRQEQPSEAGRPAALEAAPGSARHRRPAYDFDDAGHAPAPPPHTGYPQPAGPLPRSPLVPGPGFGGPPQGRTLAPGHFPGPAPAPSRLHSAPPVGPLGFVGDEDDDEPDSLVPSSLGLRRHQRRLLIQTGVILGAIGVLCWLAVDALTSSPTHATASGTASRTAGKTTPASGGGTAAGGLTNQSPTAGPSKTADASPTPSAAPSTVHSSAPDAASVSSVHVTLLGGSSTVPQIVALVTVDTGGTGQVTVTGSYYGASGSKQVAAESEEWVLSGKTAYQYSVPIANSAYCGTDFHFTVSAGGHAQSGETSPGC